MRYVSHSVNTHANFANRPTIELMVDALPKLEDYRYEKRGNLYFAELEGNVSFFSWTGPGNEDGYGGRSFPITMIDGTAVTLKGPWSSRSAVMNAAGFPLCTEVTIVDKGMRYASAVTLDWLARNGINVVAVDSYGEVTYEPVDVNGDLFKPLPAKR